MRPARTQIGNRYRRSQSKKLIALTIRDRRIGKIALAVITSSINLAPHCALPVPDAARRRIVTASLGLGRGAQHHHRGGITPAARANRKRCSGFTLPLSFMMNLPTNPVRLVRSSPACSVALARRSPMIARGPESVKKTLHFSHPFHLDEVCDWKAWDTRDGLPLASLETSGERYAASDQLHLLSYLVSPPLNHIPRSIRGAPGKLGERRIEPAGACPGVEVEEYGGSPCHAGDQAAGYPYFRLRAAGHFLPVRE